MHKKFSIIIPVFERPALLQNTLRYLAAQKKHLEETEVIIVDDGSSDPKVKEVIINFATKFTLNYFYLAKTTDSSRSRTRNYGIAKSTGEILIFLDSDILIMDDFLIEQARYHDYYGNLLVIGYHRFLEQAATTHISQGNFMHMTELNRQSEPGPLHRLVREFSFNMNGRLKPWVNVYASCLSIRKKTIMNNGVCFDENYKRWGLEDMDFGFRCYISGEKIVINHNLEVYHQYHDGGYHKYLMTPEKSKEIRINDAIFQRRHGVSGIEEFKSTWTEIIQKSQLDSIISGNIKAKVFIFRQKPEIDRLKRAIFYDLASNQIEQLIIYDEVASDLDIWSQIIAPGSGPAVMYYPADNQISICLQPVLSDDRVEKVVF